MNYTLSFKEDNKIVEFLVCDSYENDIFQISIDNQDGNEPLSVYIDISTIRKLEKLISIKEQQD